MTRAQIIERARALTAGRASYEVVDDAPDVAPEYSVLAGPGDFQGILGEPEDATWRRDGRDTVTRLNDLNTTILNLLALLTTEPTP